MVARTGPKIRTGPDKLRGPDFSVRIFLVRSVVRIFRSGYSWSGPWSGFSGPDFHWSGPWSGFFGPDNPYRSGFFRSPVRGPDIFFQNKKIRTRTGPIKIRTTDRKIRTTDRTKKFRTEKIRTTGRTGGPGNHV